MACQHVLTEQERSRLAELEGVIERSYVEVGHALREIRDSRLYRETHPNFDAYCRERWRFSRQRAGQLIDAAQVATMVVSAGLPAPESERRARDLVAVFRELHARGDVTPEQVEEIATDFWRTSARGSRRTSLSQLWYTPSPVIEAAHRVLGEIDLDPASDEEANQTVRATRFFTVEDDGLAQPWHGRIWLNPPYGGQSGPFVRKLIDEYEVGHVHAAILCVNGHSFDHVWFRPLWDYPICFTDHRPAFRNPRRRPSDRPNMGAVFVYLGPHPILFAEEFSRFGAVLNEKPPSRARRHKRARRAA